MPRKPRLFIPGHPHHIVARGHNRDPIVFRKEDYRIFIEFLDCAIARYGVALHAWVLMTNHTHLLVTPGDDQGIPRSMQWLCSRYASYFNKFNSRSGSIWEGRYKPSLVDTEKYLLACYRYIEMNPVRAGIVVTPAAYPWSSYRQNAGLTSEGVGANAPTPNLNLPRLTPHPLYTDLGRSDVLRCANYRSLFGEVLDPQTLAEFRRAINLGVGALTPTPDSDPCVNRRSAKARRSGAAGRRPCRQEVMIPRTSATALSRSSLMTR